MEGKGEGWQEQGQLEGGRQAGQARQIRPPQQQCQEISKILFFHQPTPAKALIIFYLGLILRSKIDL